MSNRGIENLNDEVYKSALDLSETIVFEYDIAHDVMSFADNVKKYIPCAATIPEYVDAISMTGKIHPEDIKKAMQFFHNTSDDTKVRVEYLRFMDFKGEYPLYQIKARLISDGEGNATLLYGTYTKLDDNEEKVKSYSKDPLTMLDNRETVIAKINNYFANLPEGNVAGLMIVDIDDFRMCSALCGKNAADTVLLEVSRLLQRALRGADIIGRIAEDEFVVCMKGVYTERVYCERATFIIDSVKNLSIATADEAELSASIGIAVENFESELAFEKMYDKALIALEAAKTGKKGDFALMSNELHASSEYKNIRLSGRELELVKSVLDPIMTWAYAVDEQFNLIYVNQALAKRLDIESEGICYKKLKGYSAPCPECPLFNMRDRSATCDGMVYSPSLRTMAAFRATRIVLRNKSRVYIIANISDDISKQMETLSNSSQRYADAVLALNDIIWDVNMTKNSCIRLQEEKVLAAVDSRVERYSNLLKYYLDNVVCPQDRELFISVTDPERIRKSVSLGMIQIRKEMRLNTKEHGYRWYSVTAFIEKASEEDDEKVFISARDIDRLREETIEKYTIEEKYKAMMEKSEFQMEIALNNERYEHVNELTGIYVFEYDVTTEKYYICSTFDTMFELNDNMLRDEWSLLTSLVPYDDDEETFEHFVQKVKTEPDTHSCTVRLINCYKKPVWFTLTVQTLKGMNNSLTRLTGVIQNVNAEMEVKAELEFRANFDSLTGLYNSEHFYKMTRERINLKSMANFAIISIDIKRFKIINDRFGIESGNNCLKYLGELIKKSLPWDGIAGHYQADIFSVLLEYTDDQLIFDYMAKLSTDFKYEDASKCGSSLSFGIYKIRDREVPIRLMCDRARFAKHEIKGNAFVNYAVYDDKLRLVMREQSEIESEMWQALENNEFVMYLQPKYDSHTEKICGAEALVRWQHPSKGLRMPGDFLPLFENNGFVKNLDECIWEQAAKYLSRLKEFGIEIPISVNLSRIHIHDEKLLDTLHSIVKRNGIDAKLMELEITENYFMDDVNDLYKCMMDLKAEGFVLEMDDFGSGYSSLNMLRNAPIDVIKIDRFFLDEIMVTPRGRIVVENSIKMSKQLGLLVVAEGVETREQLEFVRDSGCDVVQGYYYSKPVSVESFEELLKAEGRM